MSATHVPTLHEVVQNHARERPDSLAVRFGDRARTYYELDRLAGRIASSLVREGVQPDDRIVFVGRNSDAVAALALGANRVGVTPAPLNWRLAQAEVSALIADAQARIVFFEPEFATMVRGLQDAGGRFEAVDARTVMDSGAWLSDDSAPISVVDPAAVAIQVYTSGTTGVPKGVMLTHRNLLGVNALRRAHVPWDRWSERDVTLISAPLGHIGAYGMLARSLFFGGEAVIQETFEPGAVLDAIEAHGVSKIALVPTAIRMLLDHPRVREVDYSRIDTIIYGASPITPSLLEEAMAVFGCEFAQSYGMTETSGPIVALAPPDHLGEDARMTAAGRPLPGTEVRIVDDAGRVLEPGLDGEICIRSIAVMQGYWNRPEETAAVLSPDGWLRTGDAGRLDADGYLYVRARVKDMIVSGAENIYPAEVENAISSHPAVAEVAVIGVPDAHWGEAVKAIVVPRAGASVEPATIVAWTRERIAGYKCPKSIDLVDVLPHNATGKIDKRALRARYWDGRSRQVN